MNKRRPSVFTFLLKYYCKLSEAELCHIYTHGPGIPKLGCYISADESLHEPNSQEDFILNAITTHLSFMNENLGLASAQGQPPSWAGRN